MPAVSSLLSWFGAICTSSEPASSSDNSKDFLGLDMVEGKEASSPASEQSRVGEKMLFAGVQGEDVDLAKAHADKIAMSHDVFKEFFDIADNQITAKYLDKWTDTEKAADRNVPPCAGLKLCESPARLGREKIKLRVKAKDLKALPGVSHKEYRAGADLSKQLLIRDAAVYFEERRITVTLVDSERGFWSLHNDLPGPINVEESRFSVDKTGEGIDITVEKEAGSKWPAQVRLLRDLPVPTAEALLEGKSSKPGSPAGSVAFPRTESPRESDMALLGGFFSLVALVTPAPCG